MGRYYSSGLRKAIGHYAVWRFFTAGRDDGRHFDEGDGYPLVTILRSHSTYPASGDEGSTPPSVPGGCNFIRLTGFGTNDVTVSFDGQNGYNWACYLVGLRGGSSYEYKLVLNGGVGFTYDVQASTNLVNWTPLTNVLTTNMTMPVISVDAAQAPQRYFRARRQ